MQLPAPYKASAILADVQMNCIFPDGKTFVDCVPKLSVEEINIKYVKEKNKSGFSLKEFVAENYHLPLTHSANYNSAADKSVEENIEILWTVLARMPDKEAGSLITLPYPYIVPGGRFGEIYYWDSYFTMLGLRTAGKNEMLENMVKNFSYLIDNFGYIPNGNRSYFIGRSQPPFFSLMIQLLSEIKGREVLSFYLPQLEKEYAFWMKGVEELNDAQPVKHRVVRMPGGETLNRYWDENNTARPESYREDIELSNQSAQNAEVLFRHLRAGAESGWDFSSRWLKEKDSFHTIHTTDIVPVDLNCLLLHLEQSIATAFQINGNTIRSDEFAALYEKRKKAVRRYCWNNDAEYYFDYDYENSFQKKTLTLAGVFPLFLKMATSEEAEKVSTVIKEKFLMPGGVVTTLETTGQQWDGPNGWAPLQWMTIIGLENYGHHTLASTIAERWIRLNTDVFKRTGKLMEKYNVVDTQLKAGGGEYPGQDGFGWTNGVLLALIAKYGRK